MANDRAEAAERQFRELQLINLAAYGSGTTLAERSKARRRDAEEFLGIVRSQMSYSLHKLERQLGLRPDEVLTDVYFRFHGANFEHFDRIQCFDNVIAFKAYLRQIFRSIADDEIDQRKRDPLWNRFEPNPNHLNAADRDYPARHQVDGLGSDELMYSDWSLPNSEGAPFAALAEELGREQVKQCYSIDIESWKLVEPLLSVAQNLSLKFIERARKTLSPLERETLIAYSKTPSDCKRYGRSKDYAAHPEAGMDAKKVSSVLVEKTGLGRDLELLIRNPGGKLARHRRDWISKLIAGIDLLSHDPRVRFFQEALLYGRIVEVSKGFILSGELDGD